MEIAEFCRTASVAIVAGKGGVGKTTAAATLALAAARAGLEVLMVELDGKGTLPATFGVDGVVDYAPRELYRTGHGAVRARQLRPDEALADYLDDHGMRRVSKRLMGSGLAEIVATAIPGIREVLVLGKIKQLEREGVADLIVVDAPATGHARTFLTSAAGLIQAARSGPVRAQAEAVVELLTDPKRCQVLLVTLPEELPVTEVVEAAYFIEDQAGVALGPVLCNQVPTAPPGLDRPVADAAAAQGVALSATHQATLEEAQQFALHRVGLATAQLDRLAAALPLPQVHLPLLEAEGVGLTELEELASAFEAAVNSLGEAARHG